MKWHIALGIVSFVAVVVVLSIVAVTEQDRMASFTRSYNSRRIETGAMLFENNCRSCHGPQGRGIDGVAPSINAADLFNGERLGNIGFSGTLKDYLRGVISAGRPIPSEGTNYPQRMPTWGEENGGPLRNDEIEALVEFIVNWEEVALAEGDGGEVPPPSGDAIGTDITISLPPGDPDRGMALSEGALGCSSCHILTPVGPAWAPEASQPGIGERAADRIEGSDYTGEATTAEEYLIESVVLTDKYIVEGYQSGIMPGNFSERITVQEMADLVAYMLSIR
jgi:mono/diheme cytochrome c family protein